MLTLGHNIHSEATRLVSSDTSFNILTMDGRSGVRYYSNIIAYTHSGIHRTESSDGFVLDSDPPMKGVVYDGPGDFNYLFFSTENWYFNIIYVKLKVTNICIHIYNKGRLILINLLVLICCVGDFLNKLRIEKRQKNTLNAKIR